MKTPHFAIMVIIIFGILFFAVSIDFDRFFLAKSVFSNGGEHDAENEDDDDDRKGVEAKQQLVDGSLIVRISKETQKLAGIKTVLTENVDVQSEERAFARVIDIKDLLELRSEFREIKAQRNIKEVALRGSAKQLKQLKILHEEASNISTRELENARIRWQQEKAEVKVIDVRLKSIRDNMTQRWNTSLSELALEEGSTFFERLINHEEYLILITLKANQQFSAAADFVFINRDDNRSEASKAYFISAAPFSDAVLQGETGFFRADANGLRTGMRLYVWLPFTGFSGQGINIPKQAVVWYAGKPWVYIQIDEDLFSRRSLIEPIKTPAGWLVRENFSIAEKIVVSGAQSLLSEEFKWAIPDEEDD